MEWVIVATSLCFFNNKGGVGKTTLTCNIASYLATVHRKRVLIVDTDPQCNATQYILSFDDTEDLFGSKSENTVLDVILPLEEGNANINFEIVPIKQEFNRFNVDLLPGHPKIALFEDKFSRAWLDLNNDIGALRTTNWCYQLNSYFSDDYDIIIYDVGPSLGALNRTILLGCDFFVSPMGCDTFSIMGINNISDWLRDWHALYAANLGFIKERKPELVEKYEADLVNSINSQSKFIGYTIQQYIVTRSSGSRARPTKAFEKILEKIPGEVSSNLNRFTPEKLDENKLRLGDVPHLYSLVPLSQSANTPIFLLEGKDGLVGSQYAQLNNYKEMIDSITHNLLENIKESGL
ncbi:ParA family protein [Paenibacillus sp. H1-7]|nr:ParA family protein [Paenibacillus sp. H1-7]